jgi:hypothetical protein
MSIRFPRERVYRAVAWERLYTLQYYHISIQHVISLETDNGSAGQEIVTVMDAEGSSPEPDESCPYPHTNTTNG